MNVSTYMYTLPNKHITGTLNQIFLCALLGILGIETAFCLASGNISPRKKSHDGKYHDVGHKNCAQSCCV